MKSDKSYFYKYLFFMPFFVTLVVALLVPDKILTFFPALNGFVSLMVDIVPSVQEWQKASQEPEKTAFLVSIVWFFFPYVFIFLSVYFVRNKSKYLDFNQPIDSMVIQRERVDFYKRSRFEKIIILIMFYPFLLLCVYILMSFSQPAACDGWCVSKSFLFLCIVVNVAMYSAALLSSMLVLISINFKNYL